MTIDRKTKSLKILLIGDSGTGKTNILSRLSKDEFTREYQPTTKVRLQLFNIRTDTDTDTDTDTINAVVWDSVGDKDDHAQTNYYSQDADGILMVYDITDYKSFKNIAEWIEDILELANPKAVIKLVGNKSDLDHQRAVPVKEAEQWAIDRGISFIETSALDASNATITFQWMIQQIRTTINMVNSNSLKNRFSTCGFVSNCIKKEHQIERCFQELSCDETQQRRPFHVVLIDLKKAARDYKPTIHCIEKPLEDPDLKYVALSYRWGEMHEKPIDTHVGYMATITSFDIHDFYRICKKMVKEVDLKDMDYVWVDAICVDQTNYERRKATIHQMSNIYQHASYILAVPDLHLRYLKTTSFTNNKIICDSLPYLKDIYYLVHGNVDQLTQIEEEWLNHWKVPEDRHLRQLLKSCTNHFADSMMNLRIHHRYYNDEQCLNHIYESNQMTVSQSIENKKNDIDKTTPFLSGNAESLPQQQHNCNQVDCPLDFFNNEVPQWREEKVIDNDDDCNYNERRYNRQWNQRIHERSKSICQYMEFMTSLIMDWSSRVWVISEYNIAKQKNNLKYWFARLNHLQLDNNEDITFFKFDFEDTTFTTSIQHALKDFRHDPISRNNPLYLLFHHVLHRHLNEKTFLEMMLMSKASKNEDRFYAIFPLSEHKNLITNKAMVDSWKINTLTSVKLKLFEIINTKEKLNLLFMGYRLGSQDMDTILPTFATSWIPLNTPKEYFSFKGKEMDPNECNFDLNNTNTITFHHNSTTPFLNLKPREFYTIDYNSIHLDDSPAYDVYSDRTLWKRLQSEDPYETNVLVAIPTWAPSVMKANLEYYSPHYFIVLNGNFKNNVWIVQHQRWEWILLDQFQYWKPHSSDEFTTGFNIY